MTDIELIEEFFGAKFLLLSDDPDCEVTPAGAHLRELRCFDGFVNWYLMLDDKRQMLWITAGDTPWPAGVCIMEMAVFFGGASLEVDSWKSVLKLQPNDTDHEGRVLWFTRYGEGEGRISFCTSFGVEPDAD